jgi:hypothetical protein
MVIYENEAGSIQFIPVLTQSKEYLQKAILFWKENGEDKRA